MVDWGGMSAMGMCILLYVKLIWCSGGPEMYGQLGVQLPWVYVHTSICETYSV